MDRSPVAGLQTPLCRALASSTRSSRSASGSPPYRSWSARSPVPAAAACSAGAAPSFQALRRRRVTQDRTKALPRHEIARVLALDAPLREKTLWRLLYESAARTAEVLALDVGDLDLPNRRARVVSKGGDVEWIMWQTATARLLPRLLAGRRTGPVFTTRIRSRSMPAALDADPGGYARLSSTVGRPSCSPTRPDTRCISCGTRR